MPAASWAESTAVPLKRSMTTVLEVASPVSSSKRCADLGELGGGGEPPDGRVAGPDGAAEQAVAGDLGVEAQQLLAEGQGACLGEAEADVVAQRADVGDVVVEALEFEQHCPEPGRLGGHRDLAGVLDREAVGEVVRYRAVAGDAFRERDRGAGVLALEEALDAAVQEPQPGLHLQDRLPDDGEPEVAGLDEPGVHGADRDLVHAGPVDLHERERLGAGLHRRRRPGVVAHGVPALRPVLVQDEAAAGRGARRG